MTISLFYTPPRLFFLGNPLEWVLYCNSPFPIELPTVPLYLFTAPNNSHQQHNYLQIFITRNYFTIFSTTLPRSLSLREGREGWRTESLESGLSEWSTSFLFVSWRVVGSFAWTWCCWLESLGFALWVWGEPQNRSHCLVSVDFVVRVHPLLFVLFKAARRGRQHVSEYRKSEEDLNTKSKVNCNKWGLG